VGESVSSGITKGFKFFTYDTMIQKEKKDFWQIVKRFFEPAIKNKKMLFKSFFIASRI